MKLAPEGKQGGETRSPGGDSPLQLCSGIIGSQRQLGFLPPKVKETKSASISLTAFDTIIFFSNTHVSGEKLFSSRLGKQSKLQDGLALLSSFGSNALPSPPPRHGLSQCPGLSLRKLSPLA